MVVIVAGRGLGLRPSRELDLYGEASGLKLRKLEKSRRRAFFDVTLIFHYNPLTVAALDQLGLSALICSSLRVYFIDSSSFSPASLSFSPPFLAASTHNRVNMPTSCSRVSAGASLASLKISLVTTDCKCTIALDLFG